MKAIEAHHWFRFGGRGRSALTLAELVIGMVVTALVAGSVGALMTAVSTGWEVGQEAETTTSMSAQSIARIDKILRSARQMGVVRTGSLTNSSATPAAVLIWRGDLNGDGKIQFSEVGLLEFDSANSQIVYRDVSYPSSWTAAQKQAQDSTLTDSAIWDDSAIDTFKSAAFSAIVCTMPQATHVTAMEIHRIDSSTTVRPALEYAIQFSNGGVSVTKYGVVTSRTPATLPAGEP